MRWKILLMLDFHLRVIYRELQRSIKFKLLNSLSNDNLALIFLE